MVIFSWILLILAALDLQLGIPDLPSLFPFLIAPLPLALAALVATGRIEPRRRAALAPILAAAGILWILAGLDRTAPRRPGVDQIAGPAATQRASIEANWNRIRFDLEAVAERFVQAGLTPAISETDGFRILESWLAQSPLSADRHGLALYVEEDLLAWAGNSAALPVDPRFPLFTDADAWIQSNPAGARLQYRVPARVGPIALLIEAVLQPATETVPGRAFLDYLGLPPAAAPIINWTGTVPAAGETYSLPLPAGRYQIAVTEPELDLAARSRSPLAANLGAAVLALLCLARLLERMRRVDRNRRARLFFISAWMWGGRLSLALWVWPEAWFENPLFGPLGYSSAAAGSLLRSPADLLATAITLVAQALLVLAYRAGTAPPAPTRSSPPPRGAAFAVLIALAATVTILYLPIRLAARIPDHTDWDLLRLHLLHPETGQLLLASACGLFAVAALVLVAAIWLPELRDRTTLWSRLQRHPLPSLVLAAVVMTVLLFPALAGGYRRVRRQFIADHMQPRILEQPQRRDQTLERAAARIGATTLACDGSIDAFGTDPTAFVAWRNSDLAPSGYDSSVVLFDAFGVEWSRFAVNLSPGHEAAPSVRVDAAVRETDQIGGQRQRLLRRQTPVPCVEGPPGVAVLFLRDEPGNLPWWPGRVFSSSLWAGGEFEMPRFLNDLLALRLNDRFGTLLLQTKEGLPPPSRAAQELFASASVTSRWETVRAGGETYDLLHFPDGNTLWSVGFRRPGALRLAAGFVRFLIVHMVLAAVVLLIGWTAAHRWGRGADSVRIHLERGMGGSFFRKIFLIFLGGSLLPLLSLAIFLNGVVDRQVETAVRDRTLAALDTAQRVVGDFYAMNDLEAMIRHEDLYWLSHLVGRPLALFKRGHLQAASHPGVFDSGLLPRRMPGRSYREIIGEARSFSLLPITVGTTPFLVGSASLAREGQSDMELSVFLPADDPAAGQREHQITNAALVASAALIGIVGLLGGWVTGRIAGPIGRLSRAAGRIEAGDFDLRLEGAARDEIGDLVRSFNAMAASLGRQRHDLQKRREYIEAILANATSGVVSLSPDGLLATINPAAERFLHLDPGPAPGTDFSAALAGRPDLQPLADFLITGATGTVREREIRIRSGDEDGRHLRVVRVPLPEAGTARPGSMLLLEDVTETVRSSRLTAWAEMARGIAHEIKNPLTPIQLSTEHIRRVRRDRSPEFDRVLEECLDTIAAQVSELRLIAREFSDYSRLPALQPEPTDLGPFLEETAAPYRVAAPADVEITLTIGPDLPAVRLDRRAIRRALVNLIENGLQALQTTTGTGRIDLRAERTGSEVRITVRDNGEGIDPDRIDHLFEPYFSTRESGTGLGLALTRSTVEEHGGRVEVSSRPGEGAAFTLILPVEPPAGGKPGSSG